MAAFDQGPLAKYNSLTDRHLVSYFSNERIRNHLKKNGLITKTGEVVPDAVYRVRMARREHRRRVRDLIAQAIIHKALEMERSRQIDIRKKIEEIAKIELVRRVREDRNRIGDEDCMPYFTPGNMEVVARTGLDVKRTQSEIDEYQLPTSAEENSRARLRKLLPKEEIESKHLSQLDSLTLGEYSKILQLQDRERINRLPYLGLGRPLSKHNRKPKKCKKKKKVDNAGDLNKEEVIHSARSTQSKLQSLTKISILFHSSTLNRSYEVTVEQQPCGGNTFVLFRDTLTANSVFSIVSQRHKGFPFSLTFYINGVKDSRISTCCEYKHKVGKRIGGPTGHFSFFNIEGAYPCYRCLTEQDMAKEKKNHRQKDTKSFEQKTSEQRSVSADNRSQSLYQSDNEFDSSISSSKSSSDSENEEIKIQDISEDKKKSSSSSSSSSSSHSSENNNVNLENDKCIDERKDEASNHESLKKNFDDIKQGSDKESVGTIENNYNNNAIVSQTTSPKESQSEEFPTKSPIIRKIVIAPKESDKPIDNKAEQNQNKGDSEAENNENYNRRRSSDETKSAGKHGQYKLKHRTHVLVDKNIEKEKKNNAKNRRNLNEKHKENLTKANEGNQSSNILNKEKDNRNKNIKNKESLTLLALKSTVEESIVIPSQQNSETIHEKEMDVPDNTLEMEESETQNTKEKDSTVECSNQILVASPTQTEFPKLENNDNQNEITLIENHNNESIKNQMKDIDMESSFSSDSGDSENNKTTVSQVNPNITNNPTKEPEISDFSDSDSLTTSDPFDKDVKPKELEIQSIHDDREELKLTLPMDDNDSSKPSTSDRPDHLDNVRSISNKPDVDELKDRIGTISSSSSASTSNEYTDSDSETNDQNRMFIKVENQVDNSDDNLMNAFPSEGIPVMVENDDINFKRAKEICQYFNNVKIDSLTIRNCELPNYVFNFISDRLEKHPELKVINLSGCEVEISLLNLLAKSLKVWPNLEKLILSDNQLTDYSLQNLIDMIKFLYDNVGNPDGKKQTLQLFDLSNCSIQKNDLSQLIDMVAKNIRLESFVLDGTIISADKFKEICKALMLNEHIKLISLENCQITQSMLDELDQEMSSVKSRLKI